MARGLLPVRSEKPIAIVVHYTGAGVYNRFHRDMRDKDPFDTAVRVYETISPFCAHYVVGMGGQIAETVPPDHIAQHVGAHGHGRYLIKGRSWAKDAPWWSLKWPELQSPNDLAGGLIWASGSVNRVTVGVEVSPSKTEARAVFSPEANATLREICQYICTAYAIPYDKYHIFAHCDVHPLARTAKMKSWDVLENQWGFDKIA